MWTGSNGPLTQETCLLNQTWLSGTFMPASSASFTCLR